MLSREKAPSLGTCLMSDGAVKRNLGRCRQSRKRSLRTALRHACRKVIAGERNQRNLQELRVREQAQYFFGLSARRQRDRGITLSIMP